VLHRAGVLGDGGALMDLVTLFKEYGWMGLVLVYFAPRVWTFFADRFFPARIKEREQAAEAVRATEATLLKARIDRDDRESAQRLKLEERSVATQERQEAILSAIQISISGLQVWATNHDRFTFNSTQDLKQGIEKLHDLDEMKKKTSQLEKDVQTITQERIKKGKP
jgi:hypothetical protein